MYFAIVTNTTLNVTRLFGRKTNERETFDLSVSIDFSFSGRYMEMIEMLKPIAFDVVLCMTQLFDYYLYTIYSLFACDMVR